MQKNLFRKGLVIGIICLFIGAGFVPSVSSDEPETKGNVYVDNDALPSWYDATHVKTIQEGIDNASAGNTVFVYIGTYVENVVMKDQVNLIGESADTTIIQGTLPTSDVVTAEDVHNAVLTGFQITTTRPAMGSGIGINIQASSLLVERNVIRDIGTGIKAKSDSTAIIQNNVLYPSLQMFGIYIERCSPTIKNNIIMNYEFGIYAFGASYPTLGYNDVYDCISPYSGISAGIGSISEDPKFAAPSFDYFHLQADSPCIDTGDPLDPVPLGGGSRVDMGAFEYLQNGTPPYITSGPEVNVLSNISVEVLWTTDKSCNSTVLYGQNSGILTEIVTDSLFDTNHSTIDFIPPDLFVAEPPIADGPILLTANASDNIGIEKLDFYVDDEHKYSVFGDSIDWVFDPSDLTNGEHELTVQAHDQAGALDTTPPIGGIITPNPGETVSGSSVPIEAWGMDTESGVEKMVFYVNDEQLHVDYIDGDPGGDEHSTYYWNSYGTSNDDDVEIKVEIFNKISLISVVNRFVAVENFGSIFEQVGDPVVVLKLIKIWRGQTKREGVYYETKLYVQNIGPKILTDVIVKDEHHGFQAIQSDYGYEPRVRFNVDKKSSIVTFPIGHLMPGEVKECKIYLTPVLFTPIPVNIDYKIGKETEIKYTREIEPGTYKTYDVTYQVPVVTTIDGWWGLNEIPLTTANVLGPVSNCDYLVVTHPRNLYNTYSDPSVNALLSELASFVRHKGAVLGYLDTWDPKSELKLTTRLESGLYWSNGKIIHYVYRGWWNSLLRYDWSSNGYMLLVGETEIIPSYDLHVVVSTGEYDVPLSDNPYADLNGDNLPDIAIGRIIGNNPNRLRASIETSLGVFYDRPGYHFDSSHALLISGEGKYESGFVSNINTIATKVSSYMVAEKLHMTQVAEGDYADEFQDRAPYKDIIHFNGHGGPGGLSPFLDESHFPIDLHDTNPILLAFACSCGFYKPDTGTGVAESATANGVGVFVGSTRMSNTGINGEVGVAYYNSFYRPWIKIGQSFKDLKRFIWSFSERYYRWVLEYNIYGDPKYDQQSLKRNDDRNNKGPISTPQETLIIDFPMYNVTSVDGADFIEIPGEKILSDPGQPMVPYATRQIEIPDGYQVQDVILTDRSNLTYNTGIYCSNSPDDFLEQCNGEPPIILNHTWYPDEDYNWSIMHNISGNDDLVIVIYPFFYNNETKDVHYFRHFEFSIIYSMRSVEITELKINKTFYNPGETLYGMIELNNTGSSNNSVLLEALVESYVGKHYTDGLPLKTLCLRPGKSAVLFSWNTTGIHVGDYKLHFKISNLTEGLYDTITRNFKIGIAKGEVTSFTATPDIFNVSDPVDISMVFENTGSTNLSGTANITITSSDGEIVEAFNHSFTILDPGYDYIFNNTWNTIGVLPDKYTIHGYVLFGSDSTVAPSITLWEYTVYDVQNDTYMNIIPYNNIASVGETFDLDVYINPVEAITGFKINISTTPGFLNVTSIEPGPSWTTFSPGIIDNQTGKITNMQAQAILPYPDEEILAFTLHMKANKTGLALVEIINATITNASNVTIEKYLEDAFVEIGQNIVPIISNIYPEDESIASGGSGNNAYRPPTELGATVEDPNGKMMDIYIRWKNHNDEWVALEAYSGVGNGTYNFTPSGNDWIWGNTTYTWSVNVTDGTYWTNKTFTFTTGGSRYDVNNNDIVNFQDAGLVWIHRTSEVAYDGIYDVNQNGVVNFQDAGLTWVNRD